MDMIATTIDETNFYGCLVFLGIPNNFPNYFSWYSYVVVAWKYCKKKNPICIKLEVLFLVVGLYF